MLFHGIAVKPGKPTAFGRIDGKLVFGMPGYPDVVPVERLHPAGAGAAPHRAAAATQIVRVDARCRSAARVASAPGRHQFYTVRIENGVGGAGVQGVGRHHQHVAGRRLHRDPGRSRSRRRERIGRGEVVLGLR